MRQGIRDFLLVMFVVSGGLVTSLTSADAQQPAPTTPAANLPDGGQPPSTEGASVVPEDQPPKVDTSTDASPQEPADKSETEAGNPSLSEPVELETGADAKPDVEGSDESDEEPTAAGGETPGHEAPGGENSGHEAGDGEHHDPLDLSHQNATPVIADPSELKSDLAIWTLVVFLCLLALLCKFAWGPIIEGLDRRETAIATAIDEAEQAAAKGAEQLKLYEAKLAAAAEETREILAQARRDAEATGERIVAEAQEVAGRERDKAVADISAAKNSALQEITERSVDLAVSMAGRMIQRQLTPDDRAGLIREALDQLPNQN